jgi:ATP-dependent helicase HrpB
MADLIHRAMAENDGSCLAFLPGEGEIRRVASGFSGRLPADVPHPAPLRRVALPRPARRDPTRGRGAQARARHLHRRNLADHRGRAHRGRWRQGAAGPLRSRREGMSRLVTEDVSRAEADQRRGRAGRVAPGVCYRLWTRGQDGARPGLPARRDRGRRPLFPCPGTGAMGRGEGLAISDAAARKGAGEARALLTSLGALDAEGRITPHGRELGAPAAAPKARPPPAQGRARLCTPCRAPVRTRPDARVGCRLRPDPAPARTRQPRHARRCRP